MEDETYLADQDWRRIDADWMGIAADLAMQLDQGVNNTSLVLAFEFTDTKRVVLFPGDAQIGNWLSWQSVTWEETGVTAADLVARTVYLKVAHHGSHNATPSHIVRIPIQTGRVFRFEAGQHSGMKPARIPI